MFPGRATGSSPVQALQSQTNMEYQYGGHDALDKVKCQKKTTDIVLLKKRRIGLKSTDTSATKSATASRIRFDEWHTSSWDSALKRIRHLGGLRAFKSVLFKQSFEQKHYACEFMILSVKGKLKGAMTYSFEEWNESYKVGPIWHICDFDTARGTSGMGHILLSRFMDLYGSTFYLWCWDRIAEKFWRHMGRCHSLSVRKIGVTPWGTAVLLFFPAPNWVTQSKPA